MLYQAIKLHRTFGVGTTASHNSNRGAGREKSGKAVSKCTVLLAIGLLARHQRRKHDRDEGWLGGARRRWREQDLRGALRRPAMARSTKGCQRSGHRSCALAGAALLSRLVAPLRQLCHCASASTGATFLRSRSLECEAETGSGRDPPPACSLSLCSVTGCQPLCGTVTSRPH